MASIVIITYKSQKGEVFSISSGVKSRLDCSPSGLATSGTSPFRGARRNSAHRMTTRPCPIPKDTKAAS